MRIKLNLLIGVNNFMNLINDHHSIQYLNITNSFLLYLIARPVYKGIVAIAQKSNLSDHMAIKFW